ncbi:MAG: hypothetical protein A2X61_05835 [Ignavibacteria bacterium GWB2_35_12]|nr:MAG: hypothetical protein A2X63_00670 [Ignavibacteria bacterium GWA2_35_8]OGU42271.1 MAG: hypothetical protein A2X61_05835 [Ignavibacteria bacterium GWB2_35_12]OGU93535.1 MAG: hypothetical protein A2220_13105 [Ignavibacteria bacterium RIFOXYA2_FULL_35_10]OGV22154.1 MAG: hypothetical protein A2475_05590 [Ignavibacteria bacterium RIFOXYC2_FULL_35_21]
MLTDTEIRIKGILALSKELGEVQAEKFISLIQREPFDYTTWQRNLFLNNSVDEVSKEAMMNLKRETDELKQS